MQSKGLSRVFCNITVQKHQFFGPSPSLEPDGGLAALVHTKGCSQHAQGAGGCTLCYSARFHSPGKASLWPGLFSYTKSDEMSFSPFPSPLIWTRGTLLRSQDPLTLPDCPLLPCVFPPQGDVGFGARRCPGRGHPSRGVHPTGPPRCLRTSSPHLNPGRPVNHYPLPLDRVRPRSPPGTLTGHCLILSVGRAGRAHGALRGERLGDCEDVGRVALGPASSRPPPSPHR